MADSAYVRGNLIAINATFLDVEGDEMSPPSAKLYVVYKSLGLIKTDKLDMVADGNVWTAIWNSVPADAGIVSWHARAGGNTPAAIEDTFTLLANHANPTVLGLVPAAAIPNT